MNDEPQVFVNIQVPVSVDLKLREIAAKKRTSRSEIGREGLSLVIEKYDQDSPDQNNNNSASAPTAGD